jgi:hypothetical protein
MKTEAGIINVKITQWLSAAIEPLSNFHIE